MSYIDPFYKVLWHTDRIAQLKWAGRTGAPVNVEIDLSNRCSLGCEWCHFAYTHTRGPLAGKRDKPQDAIPGGDLMDTDLIMRVGDEMKAAGVCTTTWTGGGEPTLHPDFDDIIAGWPLPQGIYTHGGHISPERAWMLKRRMTWIYISLDECNAEDYKQSKGVDRFDEVLRGAQRLVGAAGDATIGIGFLLHEGNWRHIHEMRELGIEQLDADYVQFRPIVEYDQDAPGTPTIKPDWIDDAITALSFYNNDRVYASPERFEIYRDWQGHGYDTCYWSMMQTAITPNGKMWVCVNKREHPDACIGDLSNESFSDIWQRHKLAIVDNKCRVLCRGHFGNVTLDKVLTSPEHEGFI